MTFWEFVQKTLFNVAAVIGALATIGKSWQWITRPKAVLQAKIWPNRFFKNYLLNHIQKENADEAKKNLVGAIAHLEIEETRLGEVNYYISKLHNVFDAYCPAIRQVLQIDLKNTGKIELNNVHVITYGQEAFFLQHEGLISRFERTPEKITIASIRPDETVAIIIWSSAFHENTAGIKITHATGKADSLFCQEASSRGELFILKLFRTSFLSLMFLLLSILLLFSIAFTLLSAMKLNVSVH